MSYNLTATDFGFIMNPHVSRLEHIITALPTTAAPVAFYIEPVPVSVGTFLRVATYDQGEELSIGFEFKSMDALLMATANPPFIASALWELATQKLPGELAEVLIDDPACDLPAAFDRLAERKDPDTPFDFTRYQVAQVVFATVGATPETD